MKRLVIALALLTATVQAQIIPSTSVIVQDEGATQGQVRTLNCTGAGITCTVSGATGTLNATGGSGGGNFLDVTIELGLSGGGRLWQSGDITPDAIAKRALIWVPECSRFVGVGASGNVYLSTDGKYWTTVAAAQANSLFGVAYAPSLNRLALVSVTGVNRVQTSDDCGASWTVRTAAEANSWLSIAWSPSLSLFAAVSSDGVNRVQTSSDGITWAPQAAAAANGWQDIVWSPEQAIFLATSNTGANRAMTSANGTLWTSQALTTAEFWDDVTWSAELGLFVAVASSSAATVPVVTSPTGVVWTDRTAFSANWRDITYSPEVNLLVAVGAHAPASTNRIMTSPDAVTWTIQQPIVCCQFAPLGTSWAAVAWSPTFGRFAALGSPGGSGQDEGNAMYSDANQPGLVYTATITGASWVAADSQILCNPFGSTTDGLTPETVFASGIQAIASNRVVGTGFDLSIYTPHGASGTYRFHCTGS